MRKSDKSFTFIVLAFNHSSVIFEHLESIKYLIGKYKKEYVDIIVCDDASTDDTVSKMMSWLNINRNCFETVRFILNDVNTGTCQILCKALRHVRTDLCKITAGDDVYSFEDIFNEAVSCRECIWLTGIPIDIRTGILQSHYWQMINVVGSALIYKHNPANGDVYPATRNAPNLIYNWDLLQQEDVSEFCREFDVVEDWPLQIRLDEKAPGGCIGLTKKALVYYRRTSGSTYIIANMRFRKDRNRIFEYLIKKQEGIVKRWILKNRYWVFRKNLGRVGYLLNFSIYVYLAHLLVYGPRVALICIVLRERMRAYRRHFKLIQRRAAECEEIFDRSSNAGQIS